MVSWRHIFKGVQYPRRKYPYPTNQARHSGDHQQNQIALCLCLSNRLSPCSGDANHCHGLHLIACDGPEYLGCSLREKQTLKCLDMRYRFVRLVANDKDDETARARTTTTTTASSSETLIR